LVASGTSLNNMNTERYCTPTRRRMAWNDRAAMGSSPVNSMHIIAFVGANLVFARDAAH
jgi:hypothetical protein